MGNPATWSVSVDVGIVAGIVVLVGSVFCIVNHQMNKRKARKTKAMNEQRPVQMNSREHLVGRKLEEGDTATVEDGYSRSMTNFPAPSYVFAPTATVVDWGDVKSVHSARSVSSGYAELPVSRNGSVVSIPAMPKKPSPLRLAPYDAPLSRTSVSSSFGGSYIPPVPPPRSSRRLQANSIWVNPLDVHFSKPTTPQSAASGLDTYFPQQHVEQEKNALPVPTPAGPIGPVNSEAASIISSAADEPTPQISPTLNFNFNFFDPEVPTRPSRQSTGSIFPTPTENRPVSNQGGGGILEATIPPLNFRQSLFGPESSVQFGEGAVIRDSIVSKRCVSIQQPPLTPTEQTPSHHRAVSSIYSTSNTISRPVSPTAIDLSPKSRSRSRSRSTSSNRPPSISQTRDSTRRLSRHSVTKKRDRERDQIHYDPTSHHRNRSGSVQGRAVDFDQPRENPFSNSNTIFSSASAPRPSSSYVNTSLPASDTNARPRSSSPGPSDVTTNLPIPRPAASLSVGLHDSDRLSVATATSHRGRSASEASQASMGFSDFYDAYYRQSQVSRLSHVSVVNGSRRGSLDTGVGIAVASSINIVGGLGKRPPPLRYGAGMGSGVEETIVEVASPMPSPAMGMERFERFDMGMEGRIYGGFTSGSSCG